VSPEDVSRDPDLASLDILEEEYPNLPFLWLETEDSSGEVFALTQAELLSAARPEGRSRKR